MNSKNLIITFILLLISSINLSAAESDSIECWIEKGQKLVSAMKFEEAIECWNKALEIDDKNTEVWHSKGLTLYYMEDFQGAIECYDKVIEINPKHSYAWCDRGRAFYKLEKYEEAIKCYDKTLELDPKDIYAEKFKEEALKAMKEK